MNKTNKFRKDIDYLIRLISNVHPLVDSRSKKWYKECKKYIKSLETINTYDKFYFCLSYILSGFEDSHIKNHASMEKLSTPMDLGINAVYDYQSKSVKVIKSRVKGVKVGDKIVKVNNVSINSYLNSMIYSFGGVKNVPVFMMKNSIKMFFQFTNQNHKPIKSITLKSGKSVQLGTGKPNKDYIKVIDRYEDKLIPYIGGKISMKRIKNDKELYIRLPTFYFESKKDIDYYEKILEQLKNSSNRYKKITIDVRGNGGGDSMVMERLVYTLFKTPAPYLIKKYQTITPDVQKVWKKEIIDEYMAEVFGKNSKMYKDEVKYLKLWKKKNNEGERMLTTTNKSYDHRKYTPKELYCGKVEIVIDERCGSATLRFIDLMYRKRNVTLKGTTTGCDSEYYNAFNFTLPNSKEKVQIVTIYGDRKPKRKHNKYFTGYQ